MLTCKDFTQQVTEYLDNALPTSGKMGIWMHFMTCGHCRKYLRQIELVAQLSTELPDPPENQPSPELRANLLAAYRDRQRDS